jgi:hypothetical protein
VVDPLAGSWEVRRRCGTDSSTPIAPLFQRRCLRKEEGSSARRGRLASNVVCWRSVFPALNLAGLVASGCGLPDHPKSHVRRGRGNQHLDAFEGDRRVEPVKQRRAATQQDRDHVHGDYTDSARRHFSSASHPIKARLSVLRPPYKTNRQGHIA